MPRTGRRRACATQRSYGGALIVSSVDEFMRHSNLPRSQIGFSQARDAPRDSVRRAVEPIDDQDVARLVVADEARTAHADLRDIGSATVRLWWGFAAPAAGSSGFGSWCARVVDVGVDSMRDVAVGLVVTDPIEEAVAGE